MSLVPTQPEALAAMAANLIPIGSMMSAANPAT
jgi:hypothetical protein